VEGGTVSGILVTGANGFVGPHLARALHEAGLEVHGAGLGRAPEVPALASWRNFDLFDATALDEALAAVVPDGIVHLAGQSSAAASFVDPEGTFRSNRDGTRLLLEGVRRRCPRARFLMVSTSDVYGPQPEGAPVAEDAACGPVSPYAASKLEAERLVLDESARGLHAVVARSFAHTGPGQTDRFVVPSFARQIAAIEAGAAEPVLRVGNLAVTRDIADVRDVVRAYLALLRGGTTGTVYNVCRGVGVRLSAVVESLVARSRVPVRIEVDAARLRTADVTWLVGDPARIAAKTGWRAVTPLDETLADVLQDQRSRVADGPR
jgi:GDP-4-dehydro-6-deoxy-D-mannose reductase